VWDMVVSLRLIVWCLYGAIMGKYQQGIQLYFSMGSVGTTYVVLRWT